MLIIFFLKIKFHLLTLANASEITNDNNELLYHMGRAETSGGAGAQSIKWGTWKQGFK